jgi:hypothetical protein
MADPIFLDLVKETTILTGTGDVTLLGAAGAGFNTFYQAGKLDVGDTFYYVIGPGAAEWEVGLGTLLTSTTFSRTPTDSSNAGALVDFSAGLKVVALDAAAAALTSMLYDVIAIGRIPDLSSLYVTPAALTTALAPYLTSALAASTYSTPSSVSAQIAGATILTSQLSGDLDYSRISGTGPFADQYIPNLNASKINAGDLAAALMMTAWAAGGYPFKMTTLETTGNAGIGGAPGAYRLEVTSTLEPVLKLTNSAAPSSWYQAIGQGNQYAAGYFVISQGVPTASNYEVQFQGSGIIQVKSSISSPAFASFITGVGNSAILSWTNTGGNFNGYAAFGARHGNTGSAGSDLRLYMGTSAASKIEMRDWNEIVYATMLKSGFFGLGAITPTAPLDINGSFFRLRDSKTPASATDTGNKGEWCYDTNYIYVWTAANIVGRAALSYGW